MLLWIYNQNNILIIFCSIRSGEESEEVKDTIEETPRAVEDKQDATILSDQEESDEDEDQLEDEQEQGKLKNQYFIEKVVEIFKSINKIQEIK